LRNQVATAADAKLKVAMTIALSDGIMEHAFAAVAQHSEICLELLLRE